MRAAMLMTAVVGGCGVVASAGTIDFESLGTGTYNPLTITNVLGSGASADFVGGSVGVAYWPFFLGSPPAGWGNQGLAIQSYTINFSSPAFRAFEIEFSLHDYDTLGAATADVGFEVYSGQNGLGMRLDSSVPQSYTLDAKQGEFGSMTFDGSSGIGSIVLTSTASASFWDNLTLVAVPLPGAAGMGTAGLLALGVRRSRSARAVV